MTLKWRMKDWPCVISDCVTIYVEHMLKVLRLPGGERSDCEHSITKDSDAPQKGLVKKLGRAITESETR